MITDALRRPRWATLRRNRASAPLACEKVECKTTRAPQTFLLPLTIGTVSLCPSEDWSAATETTDEKPSYNLLKIKELLKEAEAKDLPFDEKWTFIGNYFGVSSAAVRKWYYRAKNKSSNKKKISSDQWRTAYLVLTGETSRDTIPTIKRKISHLLK